MPARTFIALQSKLEVNRCASSSHPLHNCGMDFYFIDPQTQEAVLAFKTEVVQKYPLTEALLFRGRSRRGHHGQSDADVAILLGGQKGKFLETKLDVADGAVEVFMVKGGLIQPLPLWGSDGSHLEDFSNPYLIRNIQREGIAF